jgi:outer membrane immunogenic protein
MFAQRFALTGLVVACVVVDLGQFAVAQDKPAAVPAGTWSPNWSGFYLGGNFGYGVASSSVSEGTSALPAGPQVTVSSANLNMSGFIGGAQAGFNWQATPYWLFGLEGDFQWSAQRGSINASNFFVADAVNASIRSFGTLRGRAGVITNDATLWYLTGGWAYGRTELNLVDTFQPGAIAHANSTISGSVSGWTIGGGLETRIGGNWSGKIEYLYLDLGSVSVASPVVPGFVQQTATLDIRDHIIRAGLNYHFGQLASTQDTVTVGTPQAAGYNWSGFYGGANAGYGLANASVAESIAIVGLGQASRNSTDLSIMGAVVGGQIGYNWQPNMSNWLLGLETDFQWSGQRGSTTFAVVFPTGVSETVDASIRWFGTVRGRAGFVTDNANLWYVTGGLAYAQTDLSFATNITGAPTTFSSIASTMLGWTLGGGLESHLGGNWTGKIEYLYLGLGNLSGGAPLFGGLAQQSASMDLRDHIIRVGLNYRFGGFFDR